MTKISPTQFQQPDIPERVITSKTLFNNKREKEMNTKNKSYSLSAVALSIALAVGACSKQTSEEQVDKGTTMAWRRPLER